MIENGESTSVAKPSTESDQAHIRIVWVAATFVGAVTSLEVVWAVADVFNGAMALPNLIALVLLSGVVVRETKDYLGRRRANSS